MSDEFCQHLDRAQTLMDDREFDKSERKSIAVSLHRIELLMGMLETDSPYFDDEEIELLGINAGWQKEYLRAKEAASLTEAGNDGQKIHYDSKAVLTYLGELVVLEKIESERVKLKNLLKTMKHNWIKQQT